MGDWNAIEDTSAWTSHWILMKMNTEVNAGMDHVQKTTKTIFVYF